MIRFKKAAAADVPVPPAGYVTLFVDTATGQPSAKDSAGVVVSLKGTDGEDGDGGAAGLPEGGAVGQVVTKTEGGAAWADAPAGGTPAGTWTNMLPPDGTATSGKDALASAAVNGEVVSGGGK